MHLHRKTLVATALVLLSRRTPAGRLARLGLPEAPGMDPCSDWRPWSSECGQGAVRVAGSCVRSCGEPSAASAAPPRGPARAARGSGRGLHHTTRWPAGRREHSTCDTEGGMATRRPTL